MANENERPRTGGRAAVIGGRRAPGIGALGGNLLQAAGEQLAGAFRAEAEAARLAPWLPVFFGIGIIVYFAAPAEPSWIAAMASFSALAFVVFLSRARPVVFAISLALAATAAGFAAGTLRGALVAHPVLIRPTATLTLAGFVEARDATDRSDRLVLHVTSTSGRGADHLPPRVRVSLRRGNAPEVGSHVEMKARLRPLLSPTRPGGYDYALGAYFARLGATGFVLGKAKAVAAPMEVPSDIRLAAAIESVRRALTARILAVIPGQTGAVATALISGVRDQISAEVNEAMRISGLYHVLSISGLHMAIVVGFIFAAVRGGLALIPGLALRFPIKKCTAVLALLGAFVYMLLAVNCGVCAIIPGYCFPLPNKTRKNPSRSNSAGYGSKSTRAVSKNERRIRPLGASQDIIPPSNLRNTSGTDTFVRGLFPSPIPAQRVPEMLTSKQYELLRFIHERLKESGVPPSFEEMKEALNLRSKSGIHRLITALEERGFIRRLPNRARALEVLRLPETVAPGFGAKKGFSPNVIEGSLGRVRAASEDDGGRPVAVPVMGRIAAGTPIAAIQTRSHTIHVPPEILSSGDHFALEVRGDSMIEAGIFEGDLALIRKSDTADTGDIVVALIDEEEATLKRLRKKGASIALEAANPAYETRIFGPDRVRIQGKLVGLFRRY